MFGTSFVREFKTRAQGLHDFMLQIAESEPSVARHLTERKEKVGEVLSTFLASFYATAAIEKIKEGATIEEATATYGISSDLEEQCFVLYEYYTTYTGFVITIYAFYIDHILRPEFSIAYAVNQFMEIKDGLADPNKPVIFGNSPSNPARFPSRGVNPLNYFDDRVKNKIRFNDAQDLVDETLAYLAALLDTFQLDEVAVSDVNGVQKFKQYTVGTTAVPRELSPTSLSIVERTRRELKSLTTHLKPAIQASLCYISPNTTAGCLFDEEGNPLPPKATSVDPAQAGAILGGWASYIRGLFTGCSYRAEIDGQDVRFSVAESLVVSASIIIPFLFIGHAFPTVGNFVFSFVGIVGAAGVVGAIVAIGQGWSIGCFPSLPPILFTASLPQFITNTLAPECLFIGSGLIPQTDYDTVTCRSCALWESGHFTMGHCARDWGWTGVLDVPVFFLKAVFPDALAYISNPNNFAPPFSFIFEIDWVRENLARWDDLDLYQDDVVFSSHWTCLFVNLPVFVVVIALFAILFAFGPVQNAVKFVLRLLYALVRVLWAFTMALFASYYYMLSAPMTMTAIGVAARAQMRR